ncbi:hypothetical protein HPO96_08680 [Kribbella sandramycini]|uniref:Uncharacterized protein n=1 Tax=Kribbella sandramycini TaxID=60450 RepID=A0A7Y4KYJ9_9ACTN|nr:hypothetical protein [Kribbella sandramycini]MBB6569858.1 hypothetical protein [Kribbella sandramycini]NOL40317.1 hypothetical protein [Kribbella sandramycini]
MSAADQNLLHHDTVAMTVFAQDPIVLTAGKLPLFAQLAVPAERLQRGPRGHRFHVVDVGVGTNAAAAPVVLNDGDPWTYRDRWDADHRPADPALLVEDADFRAQNLFAVAAHTLALFERHLGRPIPWQSRYPQLYLVPRARIEANAFYSREHNAVLFGWLPATGDQPSLYTALSYDVIAHEVSHAILDGLRPRYTEPGLPDQLAFHEALADIVALLSVFSLKDVAKRLLDNGNGKIVFPGDEAAMRNPDQEVGRRLMAEWRAAELKATPLTLLAEQIGGRRTPAVPGRYPALRRSVDLPASSAWTTDPAFLEPHRRAEVLVAAFLQTLVAIWAARLDPLRVDQDGVDVNRVAEEGVKSAQHLLGMLLRALDYLPPAELEFADVIDAVLTADRRLASDDDRGYRDKLRAAFAAFGITPPEHQMVDEDGDAAPPPAARRTPTPYRADPDAKTRGGIRYEHLNLAALRTSPEEVYQFIWNNAGALGIDVRLTTRVERVLGSTRVGPDGLVLNETIADYVQILRALPAELPPGIDAPDGLPADEPVELLGGGVLVFDQFGRFRLHQRKPVLDVDRQNRRLQYLAKRGFRDGGDKRRFALLHDGEDEQ